MLSKLHRWVFGSPSFDPVAITSGEPISSPIAETPGELLRVQPYTDAPGLAAAAAVFRALHPAPSTSWGANASTAQAFELWAGDGTLTCYLHAPTQPDADQVRQHLTTHYPNSDITTVTDGPGFPRITPTDTVVGARVSTTLGAYYPIRHHTTEGFDADPYGDLTQAMQGDESRVVVQVVFRPANDSWTSGSWLRQNSIDDVAHSLRQGTSVGWLNPRTRPPSSADTHAAQTLEQHRDKPAFHANIRILAVSPSKRHARRRVQAVANIFANQYPGVAGQTLEATPVWHRDTAAQIARLRKFVDQMTTRTWTPQQMVLTVDELASVAHLPRADVTTPTIDWRHTHRGNRIPADAPQSHTTHDTRQPPSTPDTENEHS